MEENLAVLRSSGPYIWVTWLTKLLVGENSFEWASWFKAQHESGSWNKLPSDIDFTKWKIRHTEALNGIRDELKTQRFSVSLEGQNKFSLRGGTAVLGGQPDLVAVGSGMSAGTIVDVKTGRPRSSHNAKLILYMSAVLRALDRYKGFTVNGKLVSQDREVSIPASEVDSEFVASVASLIPRIASSDPPIRVQSISECRYCDISSVDCQERAAGDDLMEGTTDDF